MLSLILAIEGFAAKHEHDLFLKIDAWTWKQTGRRAERTGSRPQLVCFGDSLVQVGLASPIIEKHAGLRTCNLAISGGQAASSYVLLRRVLDAGTRPDALIVDFFPRHLQSSPLISLDPWTSLATFNELVDLARMGGDGEFLGRAVLAKLLPTVRSRPEIRSHLVAALNGEDRVNRHHVPPFLRRNLEVNRGGLLCPPPSTSAPAKDLEAWSRTYFPADWACHPVNASYVRRFLRLAAAWKIPVFWLLPPLKPSLQERCERTGFDAKHQEFVRGIQAEFSNVTVLDGRHANYDSSSFFDPHHLARDGAAVLSFDVAMMLRRTLRSDRMPPRWVNLPTFGKRRIDGPLEDVEQSRVAARLEKAKRIH